MKKSFWPLFIAILAVSENLAAVMEGLDVSARSVGMADAFSAVADDDSAILHNPAGLIQMDNIAVSAQSANFLNKLSNKSNAGGNSVGLVYPIRQGQSGVIGFLYQNFKAATYFTDQTLYLSYAKKLSARAFGLPGQWSIGGNIKQFTRRYESNQYTGNAIDDNGIGTGVPDPLFAKNGFSKTVYAADVGLLYQFGEKNRDSLGFLIANLNQPDISLENDGDRAPRMNRIGLARKYSWGLLSVECRKVNRIANQSDSDVAFGGERKIPLRHVGSFCFRAGYAQGSRGLQNVYAGMSFGLPMLSLDYAFQFPIGNLTNAGENSFVTLSFNFGVMKKKNDSSVQDHHVYEISREYYLTRKAEGASIQERLTMLQALYLKYGSENIDMVWLAHEFENLK